MPEQAQITSIEAIEAFRSQLVVYLAQMRPVLDETTNEVLRTRAWLEDDRKRYWQQELRLRARKLEDARQELFNANMSRVGETTSFQQLAVQRAQRELRVVEDKLAAVRKWDRELDNKTAPLVKQMEQLHGFLSVEMERAVAYLDQMLTALHAYRSVGAPATSGDPGGAVAAKAT
jgi:predicted  nucleic acid-binding Zn-ribbon protein